MAVTASYTYSQTAALTIAFTDTSTGSPNKWLWDFDDGFTSSDQNPTHVFPTNGSYTVTLKAWVQTGSTVVPETFVSGRSKSGSGGTGIAAYNSFIAKSWTNHPPGVSVPRFRIQFITNYVVSGGEASFSYDLSALSGGVAELQIQLLSLPNPADSFVLAVNAGTLVDGTIQNTWVTVQDVSSSVGSTHNESWRDGSSYTFGGLEWGSAGTRVVHWTSSDSDTDSQIVTVSPFSADFSAVPSAPSSASPGPVFGVNPQSVDFTDQSDAGADTWSWRKRRAGTDDAFVEFSTDQHPTHIFDKDSP